MPLQRLHLRPPGGFFHACGMDACNKVHPAVKALFQRCSFGKRAQLVHSIKGSQGGYQLARAPREIAVYDILAAIELALVESAAATTVEKQPALDRAMQAVVFQPLDAAIQAALKKISLDDVLAEAEKQLPADNLMYFI